MTNSDISEGDVNSQPLIERWLELGFIPSTFDDVESLSPSEFETLQTTLHSAVELIQRLKPFIISDEIQQMREEINDIKNYSDVQEQFQQWLFLNAPWEPGYYRYFQQWSGDEETKSHYWHIIALCADFDESSWASLDLLQPLVSEPENYSNIINELEQLVEDEQRQRALLEKAVLQLKDKGFIVDVSSMKIIDQFSEIERMQNYSDQIDLLKLQIQSSILPYDPVLADTFTKRVKELVDSPSDEITTIEHNVRTISEHLATRLNEMNALIQKWHSEGYSYEERFRIRAEELLEWEHLLPEIEQRYHRHAGAYERWKKISKLWNPQDSSIAQIAGKLEHTDAFLDKIDALEQQWTEKELQGASLIERWEQLGFEMDIWRYKITQDPRQGLAELNHQLPVYERANQLLEKMLQLDTSLGGEEEVDRRSVLLRTMDLDLELLDDMEHWIDKKTLRNTRHRRMLQREWEQAGRKGLVDTGAIFSDLHSFETAVASIEHRTQNLMSESVASHALERSKSELLRLESRGWNITELLALHEEQPGAFFTQFSKSMETLSRIGAIQRRIAALDWRRDVNRADAISIQVRNPIELVRLEQQIPALIRHLANRPIEDENYTYTAWLPEQRPVLLPKENSSIQTMPVKLQPQSTLEEAHEAMLEAMDKPLEIVEKEIEDEIVPQQPDAETIDPPVREHLLPVEPKQRTPQLEVKNEVQPPTQLPDDVDLSSYERLLHLLGLTTEANTFSGTGDTSVVRRALASHVGQTPRDVRVDRLLRLVLRLLPQNDSSDGDRSKMIDKIADILPKYNQWVRMRLEARHMGASGDFFEDALRLGTALRRTPGPGVEVPLQADEYPLPKLSSLDELHQQTTRLTQSMALPAAGGIN